MNDAFREHDPEIESRLRTTLSRLDRRLTVREEEMVRARIARQRKLLRQLQAVALGNGDEPAPGFDPTPRGVAEAPAS